MGSGKRPHRVVIDVPLPLPVSSGSSFPLPPSDSHHLRDVLRIESGTPVEVADQRTGDLFLCTAVELGPQITLRIDEILPTGNPEPPVEIHLLFALSKGDKNDQVADWATELGVRKISFFQSERSVTRLKSERDITTRTERLTKIAKGAAQQSRRTMFPQITVARSLSEALEHITPGGVQLTCSLAPEAIPLHTALEAALPTHMVHLTVGPEGDLSPNEDSLLERFGFVRVTLGGIVLRAELAAVTAVLLTRFSAAR